MKTLQIWAMVNDNIAATRAGEPTRDDAPYAKFPICYYYESFFFFFFCCWTLLSLSLSLSRPLLDKNILLLGKKPLTFESLNSL